MSRLLPFRGRLTAVLPFALLCVAGCGDMLVTEDPPDTGVGADSGTADSGLRDGGRDSGGDSSVDDAGPDFDSGLDGGGDSGAIDGGDSGVEVLLDSGTFDAMLPDAQIVDAQILDARIADAGRDASRDAQMSDASRDAAPRDAQFGFRDSGMIDGGGLHLGPEPIDLGPNTDLSRAGAYALIGKTGITNAAASTRVDLGHLGVSPVFEASITGFELTRHSSGEYATAPQVVSPYRIYAADHMGSTSANLTSAILDMEGAYTDGAGRSGPRILDLNSGAIGGLVLVPALYTWGSSVTIASNVTLSGGANDVWIFQIANDVDQSVAARVILTGGAQARNVFWVVAGQVTIHADAHFEGIILSQTAITMQTGASFHGRALAQSLVALDDNLITAP